jgi:hypothetical protein
VIRPARLQYAGISVHAARRAAPLTSLEDKAVCHFCIVVRRDEVISRRECCLPSRASMRVRRADIAVLRGFNASAKAHAVLCNCTGWFAFSLSANRFRTSRPDQDAAGSVDSRRRTATHATHATRTTRARPHLV